MHWFSLQEGTPQSRLLPNATWYALKSTIMCRLNLCAVLLVKSMISSSQSGISSSFEANAIKCDLKISIMSSSCPSSWPLHFLSNSRSKYSLHGISWNGVKGVIHSNSNHVHRLVDRERERVYLSDQFVITSIASLHGTISFVKMHIRTGH